MATQLDAALQSMVENLKINTGRSLDDWVKVAEKSGQAKHGQLVAWLKKEHALTHGYANLVAQQTLKAASGAAEAGGADLVAAQYSNSKAALRPIYDALATKITKFGPDVELSPKKTYVSLRRNKQFGLIQPSTSTRVDVGLNLKNVKPRGRLEASGSFNGMVSHRVRVETPKDVDAELIGWLRQAYEQA